MIHTLVAKIVMKLFSMFKKAFLPDKMDLLSSVIIAVPVYLIFGLSLVFLLPLIIIAVVVVYTVRRIIKLALLFFMIKIMRKKTEKEIGFLKKIL